MLGLCYRVLWLLLSPALQEHLVRSCNKKEKEGGCLQLPVAFLRIYTILVSYFVISSSETDPVHSFLDLDTPKVIVITIPLYLEFGRMAHEITIFLY